MKNEKKIRKSFFCSEQLDEDIKQSAENLGFRTDQQIIEIAVMNFVNLSLDTQIKLVARYHMLRAQALDPQVSARAEEELTELLDVDVTPKKKKK